MGQKDTDVKKMDQNDKKWRKMVKKKKNGEKWAKKKKKNGEKWTKKNKAQK